MNPWQKVKLFLSLKETWTRIEKCDILIEKLWNVIEKSLAQMKWKYLYVNW